ncbi:hypothetical protein D9M71_558900 [compost metagenome]
MLELGFGRGGETSFLDRARLFHQRRIHRHRQSGDLLLGFLGHGGKHFRLHRLLALRGLRHRQCSLAGLGETRGELGQIATFAEELALGVDDFQVHPQMTFDLLRGFAPGFIADAGTGHAQQFATQGLRQRALGKGHALQGRLDEVRHRYEILAQGLGQVAHQGNALGFDDARHQPFQAFRWQHRQQRCRHAQGHAVARVIRFEVVAEG